MTVPRPMPVTGRPGRPVEAAGDARSAGPRTRRGSATRDALLCAAGEQFAAAGYHGASLEMILDRTGLTKGSLYFHFPSKAALAEAVLAEMAARKLRAAQRMRGLGLDPLTCLIAEIDAVADMGRDDPVVRGGNRLINDPLIPPGAATPELYQLSRTQIAAQLTRARAAGVLCPAVRPTMLARTLVALINGHRLMCERADAPDELPGLLAEMWQVVVPLIATEQWLRRLDPATLGPEVPKRSLAAVAAVRADGRSGSGGSGTRHPG